jgi:putative SOS response-associated peptidase YedK
MGGHDIPESSVTIARNDRSRGTGIPTKAAKLAYSTNNARSEELADKATYKHPWNRGQRCIIPAQSFDEPNWESGKNEWWTFRRTDGAPLGLAGL